MSAKKRQGTVVSSSEEETGDDAQVALATLSSSEDVDDTYNDSPVTDPSYVPRRCHDTDEEYEEEGQSTLSRTLSEKGNKTKKRYGTTQRKITGQKKTRASRCETPPHGSDRANNPLVDYQESGSNTHEDEPTPSQSSVARGSNAESSLRRRSTTLAKEKRVRGQVGRPADGTIREILGHYGVTIDNERLVDLLHHRPSLWDRGDPDYKNRQRIKDLWEEITEKIIGPNFECMTDIQQGWMVKEIRTRWRSLRDRFIKDVNEERKIRSGSASVPYRRHHLYNELSFLKPTLALRRTLCSTQESSEQTGTQESQETSTADTQGVRSSGPPYPSLTISRTRANRIDMVDIVKATNASLGTLEQALNNSTAAITSAIGGLKVEMERTHQFLERFYPTTEEEQVFVCATINTMRLIHPSYRRELMLRMHDMVNDYVQRPPPSVASAAQWGTPQCHATASPMLHPDQQTFARVQAFQPPPQESNRHDLVTTVPQARGDRESYVRNSARTVSTYMETLAPARQVTDRDATSSEEMSFTRQLLFGDHNLTPEQYGYRHQELNLSAGEQSMLSSTPQRESSYSLRTPNTTRRAI